MNELSIGTIKLVYQPDTGQLDLHAPRGKYRGPSDFDAWEWDEIEEAISSVTNLVPFTMLLTALFDAGQLDPELALEVAKRCRGTLHFRPNDKSTHKAARYIMEVLLDLKD